MLHELAPLPMEVLFSFCAKPLSFGRASPYLFGSGDFGRVGSSPIRRTFFIIFLYRIWKISRCFFLFAHGPQILAKVLFHRAITGLLHRAGRRAALLCPVPILKVLPIKGQFRLIKNYYATTQPLPTTSSHALSTYEKLSAE